MSRSRHRARKSHVPATCHRGHAPMPVSKTFLEKLAARQTYGDEWMDRFTTNESRDVPVAREAETPA